MPEAGAIHSISGGLVANSPPSRAPGSGAWDTSVSRTAEPNAGCRRSCARALASNAAPPGPARYPTSIAASARSLPQRLPPSAAACSDRQRPRPSCAARDTEPRPRSHPADGRRALCRLAIDMTVLRQYEWLRGGNLNFRSRLRRIALRFTGDSPPWAHYLTTGRIWNGCGRHLGRTSGGQKCSSSLARNCLPSFPC